MFLCYLILTLTGVHDCVNRVWHVLNRENSLAQFSSSSSWTTLLFASVRLAATSCSTAVAAAFDHSIGILTKAPPPALLPLPPLPSTCFFSSGPPAALSTTEVDAACRLGRPRNGKSSRRMNAWISINKLRKARRENKALTRPLAPEVSIRAGDNEVVLASTAIADLPWIPSKFRLLSILNDSCLLLGEGGLILTLNWGQSGIWLLVRVEIGAPLGGLRTNIKNNNLKNRDTELE